MTGLTKTLLIVALLSALSGTETWANDQDDMSVLKSAYLGQKPPGHVPEVFAPGIVSIENRFEGAITFSPDMAEMYFAADSESAETSIYFSKLTDGNWSPIKRANFIDGRELHPFVSPNGKRIYFTGLTADSMEPKIWYAGRISGAWGKAKMLNSPLNDDAVFFANHAKKGGLYFYNISKRGIYYASNNNETFSKIERVELGAQYHHAFIAPSGGYVIVVGRHETEDRNDNDLYVAFKEPDGSWGEPIKLGPEINTGVNEKSPSVTHDGKYLFFGRDQENEENGLANIYWVSTEIILEK